MDNVRVEKNSIENLARVNTGLESGTHFTMNGKSAEELLKMEAIEKYNTKVDEYTAELDAQTKKVEEYANYVNDNIKNMEIMPILNYILVKPFDENPFQKITKSESGLILDMGGQKPKFKNQDNGEVEEEENLIHVGTVLEVGTECKYIEKDDVIMWTKMSEVPVPFYKQGLVLVNEQRVIVTINEGLTKRFKK